MSKVKICCISTEKEAQMALEAGADYLGFVGPMPSGPGPIPLDKIAQIRASVPTGTECFYLTSKVNIEQIAREYEIALTSHIQLTDHVTEQTKSKLKHLFPHVKIVQVVHVASDASVDEAIMYAESSDFLLLDSGNPNKNIKELGGTGRTHNWEISKKIV